jgi:hypothetical protein
MHSVSSFGDADRCTAHASFACITSCIAWTSPLTAEESDNGLLRNAKRALAVTYYPDNM